MSIKKGIYAASMTIINKDLSVNVDATIKHSEKLIQLGCHGTVIGGSTGMMQLVSSNEKIKLIDKMSISKFKDNFVFGTGTNSVKENIKLMKHCINNGIDRFLIMPSAYYKYNDDGAYTFYENIVQQVPKSKIILYNFEKLSGYKFSAGAVKKLVKEFPENIIGCKDSSYNLFETLKISNFLMFPGSEAKLLKGLKLGCSGCISAVTNVTHSIARKVFDDFENKNLQTKNDQLIAVRETFDQYNLISALHSFHSIKDTNFKNMLPPLTLLSEEKRKELIEKLNKLKFTSEKNLAA